jgi:hypothetical protein
MNAIQFTTVIGPDGLIHPPAGVELPKGEIEISIRPTAGAKESLEFRARELSARRGLNWDTLSDEARAIVLDDLAHEDRGIVRPLPAPGAFKGSILYMAPDFDAPLEDMKEYME